MGIRILMLNGSSNPNGNTMTALKAFGDECMRRWVDYEIFQIGDIPIRDCNGCRGCSETGRCVFDDDGVNEFIDKLQLADGLVVGTPVYYAHPSGRVLSFLDRVFYGKSDLYAFKPAAAIAVARRAGTTASFDVLNKYFGISQMPVVGSTYWNVVHGTVPGEAEQDEEGLQTVRNAARSMIWLIKSIQLGIETGVSPYPKTLTGKRTNFIR